MKVAWWWRNLCLYCCAIFVWKMVQDLFWLWCNICLDWGAVFVLKMVQDLLRLWRNLCFDCDDAILVLIVMQSSFGCKVQSSFGCEVQSLFGFVVQYLYRLWCNLCCYDGAMFVLIVVQSNYHKLLKLEIRFFLQKSKMNNNVTHRFWARILFLFMGYMKTRVIGRPARFSQKTKRIVFFFGSWENTTRYLQKRFFHYFCTYYLHELMYLYIFFGN